MPAGRVALQVGVSSVIRWSARFRQTGEFTPHRQGGDRWSGRIEAEAAFNVGQVAAIGDIALRELRDALRARDVRSASVRCSGFSTGGRSR
jgi:transposase